MRPGAVVHRRRRGVRRRARVTGFVPGPRGVAGTPPGSWPSAGGIPAARRRDAAGSDANDGTPWTAATVAAARRGGSSGRARRGEGPTPLRRPRPPIRPRSVARVLGGARGPDARGRIPSRGSPLRLRPRLRPQPERGGRRGAAARRPRPPVPAAGGQGKGGGKSRGGRVTYIETGAPTRGSGPPSAGGGHPDACRRGCPRPFPRRNPRGLR